MPTTLTTRPTQTKVKHIILEKYLKAWGGIITNGMRQQAEKARQRGKSFDLHFVYVDCFSFMGRYNGEMEDDLAGRQLETVYGSPIIGVKALDELAKWGNQQGIPVSVNAILVEQDSQTFDGLLETLKEAGLSSRVRQTQSFHQLKAGEIAVCQADSTTMANQLINYTQTGYTFALYFLDPYGPTGIPLEFVSPIITANRHDVIINMPYQDLHKKTGIAIKSVLSQEETAIVANYDRMFGHSYWQTIAWQMNLLDDLSTTQGQSLEVELVNCYRDALSQTDSSLAVKSIPLRFPDKERTMFYLYLTTHDPDGALQMNKILFDAGYQEDDLRCRIKDSKKQRGGQLSMFDMVELPVAPKPERDHQEVIAGEILKNLSGRTVTRKEIYQVLADEPYFANEINKAISFLKRKGEVVYTSPVNNHTPITIK